MTKLPGASKIPVLTEANIRLVAETHLRQLREGTSRNPVGAQDFIESTIQVFVFAREVAEEQRDMARNCLATTLRYAPHVRLSVGDYDPDAVVEWLSDNKITHEVIHYDDSDIFLFKSYDDSLLFKLRWG